MCQFEVQCACSVDIESVKSLAWDIPLWLELLESFALGVVADDSGVEVAAQIELLCTELGHLGPQVYMSTTVVSREVHAAGNVS